MKGALILSKENKPSNNGVRIYFSCDDINEKLTLIKRNNGKEIIKRFGLEGKELGQAIKKFKHYYDDEFILRNNIVLIYKIFGKFIENFQLKK